MILLLSWLFLLLGAFVLVWYLMSFHYSIAGNCWEVFPDRHCRKCFGRCLWIELDFSPGFKNSTHEAKLNSIENKRKKEKWPCRGNRWWHLGPTFADVSYLPPCAQSYTHSSMLPFHTFNRWSFCSVGAYCVCVRVPSLQMRTWYSNVNNPWFVSYIPVKRQL